jgi:hypothetical protein
MPGVKVISTDPPPLDRLYNVVGLKEKEVLWADQTRALPKYTSWTVLLVP